MPRSEIGTTRATGTPLIATMSSPGRTPAERAAAPTGKRTRVKSSSDSTSPARLPSISALFWSGELTRYQVPNSGPAMASRSAGYQSNSNRLSHGRLRSGRRSGRRNRGSNALVPVAASVAIFVLPPALHIRRARQRQSALTVDAFLDVAGLDEAALGLERLHLDARELFGNFAERGAAGGKAFDQPLVDADPFAVTLAAVAVRDLPVAVDQARQVKRHQPPRVLRIGIKRVDPLERLPERRQCGADRVQLGL